MTARLSSVPQLPPRVFLSSHSAIAARPLLSMSTAVLSQGVGYAVVLGIGLGFAVFMVALTRVQNRYSSYKSTSVSEFTSASHSVKPGLIASGIVSAWTCAYIGPVTALLIVTDARSSTGAGTGLAVDLGSKAMGGQSS